MSTAPPTLQIDQLAKSFGEVQAVKEVSFSVPAGETLGLLGVNGAGKTTIMNMLLGLTTPSAGSITIFGKDLAKHRIEILKHTNFCTTYAQLPSNLKVFAGLYGVPLPLPALID